MTNISVKVKVKVSKGKEKKQRKKRSDAGKKRGVKNPILQTGSIDFRHIGSSATSAPNLTALAGLVASSRPAFPTFSQDQQLINELRDKEEKIKKQEEKILSTELVIRQQNMPPPPQTRPDVEQGQEEVSPAGQVRRAMGKRIARKEKEIEDLEQKSMELKERNLMADEELQQKQQQLININETIELSGLGGHFYKENYLLQEQIAKELEKKIIKQNIEKSATELQQQPTYEPGGGGGRIEKELQGNLTVEMPVLPKQEAARPSPKQAAASPKQVPPPPTSPPPALTEKQKYLNMLHPPKTKTKTVKDYSQEELSKLEKKYIKNNDEKRLQMVREELERRKKIVEMEESDFYED